MRNAKLSQIEAQLEAGLGRKTLEQRGRRSGFERRAARVITTTEFVTSLLQSLGTRRVESLADLHRDFNANHGTPDASELSNKLFLADRGYDSTAFMDEIVEAGGSFCVRIRTCLDPVVTKIHRGAQRYRKWEGQRLSAVIAALPKSKTHDLDIEWRRRDGTPRSAYRLLLRYHGPEHGWTRLMTNLSRQQCTGSDIVAAYRLRWQVELYFKELKSYANLHAFSTCKSNIAEGLIWASLCVAFLKRFFAHSCQQATATIAISTRRVAMCSHAFLATFFRCLRADFKGLRAVLKHIFAFLAVNARRANPRRERKKGRLALGLAPAGVRLR